MSVRNFVLPIFGKVKVELRNESSIIYDLLEKTKEIRRLKNLDQLGILRKKITCAHHPKFEYSVLLLHLIEAVKSDESLKEKYGLSRKITEKGQVISSSVSELLKCWALLLPIGHLHGTFAHEKAILKIICKNSNYKQKFLSSFKKLEIFKVIESIVDNEDFYKFHQVLTIKKLLSYKGRKELKSQKRDIRKAIKYVSFYMNPTKKVLQTAKKMFFILRRISYVLLDSHYCHMLFSFQSSDMTLETIKATLLQDKKRGYIHAFWEALDSYLMKELYKNASSIFIENLAYWALYLRMSKQKNNANIIRDQLLTPDSQYLENTFNKYIRQKNIDIDKVGEFSEEIKVTITGIKPFYIETYLCNLLNSNTDSTSYLKCEVDRDITTGSSIIYIFTREADKQSFTILNMRNIALGLSDLILKSQRLLERNVPTNIKKLLKSLELNVSSMTHENWESLLLIIMKYMFRSNISFTFNTIDANLKIGAFLYSRRLFTGKTLAKIREIKNQEIQDLFILIESLYKMNKREKMIVYPFNIKLTSAIDKIDKTDIDSAILMFSKKQGLNLYLLQSKRKTRPYNEAKKQAVLIKNMLIRDLRNRNKSKIFRLPISRRTSSAILHVEL